MKATLLLLLSLLAPLFAIADDRAPVEQWLKENHVPALGVGIIRDGTLREVRMYGELRSGVPAPQDAIFNVASLTKPIVAMLTLKLADAGQWKLDEPIANYWTDPDLADDPRAKQLTTRHVLSHQTGFPNWRWNDETKKLRFHFDPGTRMQYSGEGFEYLRKALEKKFGKSLSELSQTYIFTPLQMNDTQHAWDARTDDARFARWHDASGKEAYPDYKTLRANAADNLLTTVQDYGRFTAAVSRGFGLSQPLFREMVTPDAVAKAAPHAISLGWEIIQNLNERGDYVLIHSGSDDGVRTLVMVLPKTGEGLVILTNGDNGTQLYDKLITESLTLGKEIMARAK